MVFSKKIKKFFLIFTALFIFVILLLQIDDKLSPDAQMMLNSVTWGERTKANIYLAGFGVGNDKSPIEEGEKALSNLKEWGQQLLQSNSSNIEPFHFPNELNNSNDNNDCFKNADTLQKAIINNQKYNINRGVALSLQLIRFI